MNHLIRMIDRTSFLLVSTGLTAATLQSHAQISIDPPFSFASVNLNPDINGFTSVDVDADGDLDLIVSDQSAGSIYVYRNDGSGRFTADEPITPAFLSSRLRTGDMNGDGHIDIIVSNIPDGVFIVALNDGNGGFSTQIISSVPVQSGGDFAIGDLDADGDLDVAQTHFYDDLVTIYMNDGNGTLARDSVRDCGRHPSTLALGDLNHDGMLDIAFTNRTLNIGHLNMLINAGNGSFLPCVEHAINPDVTDIGLTDFNMDGNLDIILCFELFIQRFYGVGDGTFDVPRITTILGSEQLLIQDLDNDADPDILVATDISNGEVRALYNDGTGGIITLTADRWDLTRVHRNELRAGDFNNDGTIDIAMLADEIGRAHV